MACRGDNIGAHWPSTTAADNTQGPLQEAPSDEAASSIACHVAAVQQAPAPAADVAQEHSWAAQADGQGHRGVQQPAPVYHRTGTQSFPKDTDLSGSLDDADTR